MFAAMQESRQQAEYDDILRDAKQLRLDLGYALLGCQEHQAEWVGKRAQLEATLPRGVEVPHELARDVAHAEYEGEQAELRVVALQDAIEELQSMEDFIRSTKPRRAEAVALTEEIVRQLLERLNFMGFGFAMPGGAAGAPMDSMTRGDR
ncbi:hypothetical protein WJX72_002597 [[Myrmecia] bisecta]|uniref:YlbF family regulator n=1 Tax=[Myrmecia] bisecta TaxID=41462 RepID=A0AAW1R5F3_9CHLO